ncbi:IclR family transcriptional regulator [uncultured Aeromicrobium sp.]|uniref:IclR family transcriptional regulator n=1 Tax=uncultured Aeromicrobium sp. TaxID=337820 RepID=UPI0025EEDED5|nr:IclR family transcriptional regulator [uncultured Aeromicrobium sp.]
MTAKRPADSTTGRVANVLLAFAGVDGAVGITELSRTTGLSKAVVYRIVRELCTQNLVTRDPVTRRYSLGPAAFALGDAASRTSQFRRLGMTVLADLAELTGETTTLSARAGHRRVYVAQVESSQLVRISVQVGSAQPLTVGASGHAILAFLPEDEIEAALAAGIPAVSPRTETRPEAIRERLRIARERGFATTESERIAESTSFAAPVRDAAGEVLGCISVAAVSSRLDPEREERLASQVMAAAAHLSERLRARS